MDDIYETVDGNINRFCELVELINDYRKHPPKLREYSCDENGSNESPPDPKRFLLAEYQEELQMHLKIILNNDINDTTGTTTS